jgi:hypothetical protein|tara:strand:- start:19 stop:354 length:336 start_codon:yes stop_codon:yes gene_type:complete
MIKIKTILNLVILNLIQIILTFSLIVLLTSCAAETRPPLWLQAIETLPEVEGFSRAGLFTINEKIYVQYCNSHGTQLWMRYNEDKNSWRQSRYNSEGCTDGEQAVGPNNSY